METISPTLKRIKAVIGYAAQARDGVFENEPIGELPNGTPHPHIVFSRLGRPVVVIESATNHLRIDLYEVTDPALIVPIGTQEDAYYAEAVA